MARADITGQRFGRLVALRAEATPDGTRWYCRCDCGAETATLLTRLRSGHTKSCGCLQPEAAVRSQFKHGDSVSGRNGSGTRLYDIWRAMRGRVSRPTSRMYHRYGGRGIRCCEEWESYAAFRAWALSNGYADNLSIDRIDNDGNYEPANCRWADVKTQARNRSNVRLYEYRGKAACIQEHAEDHGLPYRLVRDRLNRGWTIDQALETPPRPLRRWWEK